MRLRSIPADVAISALFVAVFLLDFIPGAFSLLLDVLLAIKIIRDERRTKAPATATGMFHVKQV